MRRGGLQRSTELLPVVFTLCGLGLVASPAAAQSPIQVPAGCGSEEEFRSEIRRLTGESPALPAALTIVAVEGQPGGFELRLALEDEVRVLRDPECRILWRSAIVIAAAAVRREPAPGPTPPSPAKPAAPSIPMPPSASPPGAAPVSPAVSPLAPVAAPAPGPPPARTPSETVPVGASAAAARSARPGAPVPRARGARRSGSLRPGQRGARPSLTSRPRRRARSESAAAPRPRPGSAGVVDVERSTRPGVGAFQGGLALGVGVSGGVLPDLGAVLDVAGRIEVLPWGLDVSLRYWPERSHSRDGRTVDVSATGVRASGLYRVASALTLMAGLEVNRLVGEGAEGVSGRNADAVWQLAPTAGLSLITWDIGSLRLEIGAAVRLSLARPRFVVTGFGDLYRVPLLGGDAIIRGVWLF